MIILLDLGNSRIKIGWIFKENGKIYREPEMIIFKNVDHISIKKWIYSLPQKPKYVIGSNVAGHYIGEMITNEFKKIGCNINWLIPEYKQYKLINNYLNPSLLGPDRWAIMLGIINKLIKPHPPLLIISFGTATTIDTIDTINNFVGGLIIPGINTMKLGLKEKTDLPSTYKCETINFPKNTNQAINSGVIISHSGAIIRQWMAIFDQFHEAPTIYVTGGLWPDIKKEIICQVNKINNIFNVNSMIFYKERAVLDGLSVIAEQDL